MSIENATIGFLCDTLDNIVEYKRQYAVGKYFVDLYIPKYKIIVECDEFGHHGYKKEDETLRENFIIKELNCKFIRFNPCSTEFQLSELLNSILKIIFCH